MDYEEMNKHAVACLREEILKNFKFVEFSEEKKDGFYYKLGKKRYWFQCEYVEEEK